MGRPTSASSSLQLYGPANAVDGDPASYFECTSGFPQWLAVDFGAVYVLDRIALLLPPAWGSRSQTIAVAVGTTVGSYVTLLPATLYAFQVGSNVANVSLVSSPSTTARYINLTFLANSGWPAAQLAELQVYAFPTTSTAVANSAATSVSPTAAATLSASGAGGVTNAALGKTVSASSALPSFPATTVVDGNQTTYWESQPNTFPQVLSVDLATAKAIDRVVMRLPPSLAWGSRSQTLAIDGSLDGAVFFPVASVASYIFTANGYSNAASAAGGSVVARFVRLTFTANSAWPAAQLSELEVYPLVTVHIDFEHAGDVNVTYALGSGAPNVFCLLECIKVVSLVDFKLGVVGFVGLLEHCHHVGFVGVVVQIGVDFHVGIIDLAHICYDLSLKTERIGGRFNGLDFIQNRLCIEFVAVICHDIRTIATQTTTVSVNAALGKSASATGFVQNFGPWNAFDGDQTTYWESSNNALPQSLWVDLSSPTTIDHFVIRLPPALDWGTRIQAIFIEGSLDGTSFFSVVPLALYTFSANGTANAVTIPAGGAVARHVRVTVAANSAWPAAQISEFEVYPMLSTLSGSVTASAPSTATSSPASMFPGYDSLEAVLGGGASAQFALNCDQSQTAAEASGQAFISLPSVGSFAKWTIRAAQGGDGVTMRFTMPDSSDGFGLKGSLSVLINGAKALVVNVSSYWNWQYHQNGWIQDAPGNGASPFFRFDEVHFRLNTTLQAGDTIAILKSTDDGIAYGVDFLEIENVPAAIPMPTGAVSVTSYGAIADDGIDDLAAFNLALTAAVANGVLLYIPSGTWHLGNMWIIGSPNNTVSGQLAVSGAGIWYTKLQFTNPNSGSGGVSVRITGSLDFSNIYMNSMLRSRYNENAYYKGMMDNFGSNSVIRSVWIEHFECGVWVGNNTQSPAIVTQGLTVKDSRIRNNLADGVNFSQGTSNSTVTNCNLRNNGDDSLAVWTSSYNGAPVGAFNRFAGNTVENGWRAGGIGVFGGYGHRVEANLIVDCFACPGIRLTTDFPGFHFQAGGGIVVSGNAVVRCGTAADLFGQARGQIDLVASGTPVAGIHFTNNALLQSQQSGVQLLGDAGYADVVFDGTTVDGAGAAVLITTAYGAATLKNLTATNVAIVFSVQAGFSLSVQ
ncbi:hypothetical protein HK405_002276 [Cladochytrium tenue]|nr:hypothetical protein HK405_002276 [Cladochytrium tenue]